jgi:uncharacterized membrane protein
MPVPITVTPPATVPSDPAPSRERVRSILAVSLIGLVIVEMVWFLWLGTAGVRRGAEAEQALAALEELIAMVLTPTITLASAVLGFYYATKDTE